MIAVVLLLFGLTLWLGSIYGYLRTGTGLVMGAAILYLGLSYFRSAGEAPPDEEPEDVGDEGFRYVCPVCGLELRVEVATDDKPPRHCREKMQLVGTGRRLPRSR